MKIDYDEYYDDEYFENDQISGTITELKDQIIKGLKKEVVKDFKNKIRKLELIVEQQQRTIDITNRMLAKANKLLGKGE